MRGTAKECVPNGLDSENLKNESEDIKEDKWVNTKNCIRTIFFAKHVVMK